MGAGLSAGKELEGNIGGAVGPKVPGREGAEDEPHGGAETLHFVPPA